MAAGRRGESGVSAPRLVGLESRLENELVPIPHLSMEESYARESMNRPSLVS